MTPKEVKKTRRLIKARRCIPYFKYFAKSLLIIIAVVTSIALVELGIEFHMYGTLAETHVINFWIKLALTIYISHKLVKEERYRDRIRRALMRWLGVSEIFIRHLKFSKSQIEINLVLQEVVNNQADLILELRKRLEEVEDILCIKRKSEDE